MIIGITAVPIGQLRAASANMPAAASEFNYPEKMKELNSSLYLACTDLISQVPEAEVGPTFASTKIKT